MILYINVNRFIGETNHLFEYISHEVFEIVHVFYLLVN